MFQIAKTLIGQPLDAQPDLHYYFSHRYKAVFLQSVIFGAGWTSTSHSNESCLFTKQRIIMPLLLFLVADNQLFD